MVALSLSVWVHCWFEITKKKKFEGSGWVSVTGIYWIVARESCNAQGRSCGRVDGSSRIWSELPPCKTTVYTFSARRRIHLWSSTWKWRWGKCRKVQTCEFQGTEWSSVLGGERNHNSFLKRLLSAQRDLSLGHINALKDRFKYIEAFYLWKIEQPPHEGKISELLDVNNAAGSYLNSHVQCFPGLPAVSFQAGWDGLFLQQP